MRKLFIIDENKQWMVVFYTNLQGKVVVSEVSDCVTGTVLRLGEHSARYKYVIDVLEDHISDLEEKPCIK